MTITLRIVLLLAGIGAELRMDYPAHPEGTGEDRRRRFLDTVFRAAGLHEYFPPDY